MSLIDAAENRMLWGDRRSAAEDALSSLATSIAQELAEQLGLKPRDLYGYVTELFGGPKMSVSPELAESLAAARVSNRKALLDATERLVRAFPDEPDAWTRRIVALSNGYLRDEIPARRKEVEACLATLARLDPKNPQIQIQRAFIGMNWDNDYRGAIGTYTNLLARNDLTPSNRAGILILRAGAEGAIGDGEAAVQDFQEAVRLDPSGNDIRYNGAVALLRLGRLEEAIHLARQAVTLDPGKSNQMLLGYLLLFDGKAEESLEQLSKACGDQGPPSFCGIYGWALSLSGHHSEALSLLLPLCGSHPTICLTYARALLRAGKPAEARDALGRTASLAERDSILGRASYEAVAGNKAEALRLLRRALDLGVLVSWSETAYDPDLVSLRGDPEFDSIVARAREGSRQARAE